MATTPFTEDIRRGETGCQQRWAPGCSALLFPPGDPSCTGSRTWGRLVKPLAAGLLPWLMAVATQAGGLPAGRSLAPVDGEAFRQSHGQEALFRLRLGVDAARDDGGPCRAADMTWSASPQGRLYQQKLTAGQPYAAGLALGSWQLQQQRCNATGRPAGDTP